LIDITNLRKAYIASSLYIRFDTITTNEMYGYTLDKIDQMPLATFSFCPNSSFVSEEMY